MSTINELMENKSPGEIKVTRLSWEPKHWFQPFYIDGNHWHGPCSRGSQGKHLDSFSGYSIREEPVEMEDRWLWATEKGSVAKYMYPEEIGGPLNVTGRHPDYSIKLEWSKTSFPKEKK